MLPSVMVVQLRWLPRAVRELQTGTPISLSVGAVAALALSLAQAQIAKVNIDVHVDDAATPSCTLSISREATLARWRAFRGGAPWWGKRGPWGPQRRFTCRAVGISETVRTQADYILWDVSTGPSVCMPAAGACP